MICALLLTVQVMGLGLGLRQEVRVGIDRKPRQTGKLLAAIHCTAASSISIRDFLAMESHRDQMLFLLAQEEDNDSRDLS